MAVAAEFFLAVVIGGAGVWKLGQYDRFLRTMTAMPWLAVSRARTVARVLPLGECGLGVALLLVPRFAALATLILLAVFTAVVANELAHGRRFNCGCFGGAGGATVGPATFIRNGLLAAAAVVVAAGAAPVSLAPALTGLGAGLGLLLVEVGMDAVALAKGAADT